ncbi:MAG: hypothetical protein Q9165_004510 [Trypethelium subeluteriae]
MSDAQQPVLDKPTVEDVPGAQTTESTAPTASETVPAEVAATETKPETLTTDAPKETAEGEKAKAETEPVTHGALGYKAPGLFKLLRQLKFTKNYFWFGDEAIPQQHMDKFMRGEKQDISYPTTAWASHTGKGLLLFAKHSDQMKTPDGAINLADVSDITKEGSRDFAFKYHDHKHTFQASNEKERDGWLVAVEKTAEEAKASKEGVLGSEKYKDTIGKLSRSSLANLTRCLRNQIFGVPGTRFVPYVRADARLDKPATLATGAAAAATAKKSTDAATSDEPTEARKDSSEAEDGKKKSKSRSLSRGTKRTSLFGSLIGKKEEKDEQKEVKKEEKAEEKAEKKAEKEEKKEEKKAEKEAKKEEKEDQKEHKEGEAAAAGTAAAGTAVAIDGTANAESTPTDVSAETKKTTESTPEKNTSGTNKSTKRSSIFGSFFEKVRSPTSEKKESDVGPVPPPKDDAAPVLPPTDGSDEAPPAPPKDDKLEEAAATGAATGAGVTTATAAEESKDGQREKATATTPSKEKEGFFKRLLSESKVKTAKPEAAKEDSKVGAETAATEESTKEGEAAATTADKAAVPAEPAVPVDDKPNNGASGIGAPADEQRAGKKDEPSTPKEKRASIFGTFKGKVRDQKGDKSDAEKSEGEEKKSNKLGGIFRNPSKAIKSSTSKDTKKDEAKPTVNGDKLADKKANETAATKEATEQKPLEDSTTTSEVKQSIGDVVPEAVSVGQPQEQGAPAVQATA